MNIDFFLNKRENSFMNKNYRVYITVYKPFIKTKNPFLYIGSTGNSEKSGYLGSVCSKKWKSFWKNAINFPENFIHKTISTHKTRREALKKELDLQKKHNVVKNKKFFNESLAKKNGCFGMNVKGKYNPMSGKSRKGEKVGGAVTPLTGKKNGMFGKDWRVGKTKEELKKHAKNCARKGKNNGCFGKRFKWITNGIDHKRHELNKPLPKGWKYGFKVEQKTRAKKVKCVETNIIYESVTKASLKTGASAAKISMVCNGKRKTTGGFHWRYM